jgi:hypothetical protein
MFHLLGVAVGTYVVVALVTGEVIAKSGPWARRIERAQAPGRYWTTLAIYAGLTAALLTVF